MTTISPDTKNILRNIILKFGVEITANAKLCDAYLSDLMPERYEERYLLSAAVKDGTAAQLMKNISASHFNQLSTQFAQTQNITLQDARALLNVWLFALQGRIHPRFSLPAEPPQKRKTYLQTLAAGLVIFIIGSAIAYYKIPGANSEQIVSTSLVEAGQPEDTVTDVPEAMPLTLRESPAKEIGPAQDTKPTRITTSVTATQQKLIVPETVSKTTLSPPKIEKKPEKQNAAADHADPKKAGTAIQHLISESIFFGKNALVLKKKNIDLQMVNNLLNTTQDKFYKTQQKKVMTKINAIKKSLNASSERYLQNLHRLCNFQPEVRQKALHIYLSKEIDSRIEQSAKQMLQQHVSSCSHSKNLNPGEVKNTLMASFGQLIHN